MAEIAFIRLAEVINRKQDMRVVSVTVKPTIADCSGTIYFTDLMLQEGPALTGYTPHTEPFLQKLRVDGEVKAPVWFNGVVRGEETVILFNLGVVTPSRAVDVHLYPKSDLEAGTVSLCQAWAARRYPSLTLSPPKRTLLCLPAHGSVRRTAARRKRRAFTSTAPPGIPSIR